jgi:hypothetical protein
VVSHRFVATFHASIGLILDMPGPGGVQISQISPDYLSLLPRIRRLKGWTVCSPITRPVKIWHIKDDRLCDVRHSAEGLLPRPTRPLWQCLLAGEAPIDLFTQRSRIPISWIARHRSSPCIPWIWKRLMVEFSSSLATLNPS